MGLTKRSVVTAAAFVLLLAAAAYAAIGTGSYVGTGAQVSINSGLNQINTIHIYEVPAHHGAGIHAYTSDALQGLQQGLFLHDGKKDCCIYFQPGGSFLITNKDFIEAGTTFVWDAEGS